MSFEPVGVRLVAENEAGFNSAMASADKAVLGFGQTADKTFKSLPGLGEIATGALRQVGVIAVDAFMKAGRAAVGFVSDSISAAGDFESGMNKFAAVAGGALEESGLKLEDFRNQFIQIGKELPVSTAEVQQAAIEMVKGGIDPATIAAGGLKQVIQFAAAADLDLAQASTIAAKAIGGWVDSAASAQERADFLTHSTDLLSKAANASTVDVDDLALGLYNVQGTAKLAGVTFDDTVTTLAEVAPAFASSADAGTSFKTFLARLQPTTKPAIAAMEALNLVTKDGKSVFYDAQGNFVGMAKASELLHDATKDLTQAQREQLLQTIFGQDGIRVAAVLSEKGADGYNAMTAALEKQNSVADMAKQKQAGFNTALDNFKGSVEALQITIGSYLLPVLTELFNNYLAPGINTITSFAEKIFSAQDPFLALTTAINGVLPGFGQFVDFLTIAVPQIITFVSANWDTITNALTAVAAAVGTLMAGGLIVDLVTTITALGAAFTAAGGPIAGIVALLGGPVTLAIAGVALVVGGLVLAWENDWGGIQEKTAAAWDVLEPIFSEVAQWLGKNIPVAVKTVSDFWTGTLYPALQKVWSFIQTNIIPIVNTLVTVYLKAAEVELKILAGFWTNTLLPALTDVWKFISTKLIPLFDAVTKVQIALLKLAVRELTDTWNTYLLPAITAVYNWFNNNIVPIFDTTKTKGSDLAQGIRGTLGPAWQWLSDNVLSPVVGWFGKINDAISGTIKWLNDLADKINSLPSLPDPFVGHSPPPMAQWFNEIGDAASSAASWLNEAAAAVANLPSSIPSWFSDSSGDGGFGGGVWGNSGGGGSSGGGPWGFAGRSSPAANPLTLMARGTGTGSAVYNQQRTANITYHTQVAPPVHSSLAIANALAG